MTEKHLDIPHFEDNPDFSIVLAGITYANEHYHLYRPNSNVASIEFILSGTGTLRVGDQVFHPKKNDTMFLKLNEEQEFYSSGDDPWTKIWFSVQGNLVDTLVNVYGLQDYHVSRCQTKPCIERVHSLLTDKNLTPDEIAGRVALSLHEAMMLMSESLRQKRELTDAEIIKQYIDLNVYSPISIEELAQLIFKSPSQTIRIFKKQYDMTPYDYYIKMRLETAISLLKNTNMSIQEIATRLHFSDEHYFSYFLKQKTGKTPTKYRQQG